MFKRLLHYFRSAKDTNPEPAYNLWAKDYDNQPDNLMLALDEALFTDLLAPIDLNNKTVADIGCGTGRHWQTLVSGGPAKLLGFDISEGMLAILQQKFKQAQTYRLLNNKLAQLENGSCDLLISTLTIAHIENAEEALLEWTRVLKPGGDIIITDYHPIALAKGGKRTFKHNDDTVSIKNYIHPIEEITALAKQLQLQVIRSVEKNVDQSMKHYYEKQHALNIFENWNGIPIIYGMHLKKANDPA